MLSNAKYVFILSIIIFLTGCSSTSNIPLIQNDKEYHITRTLNLKGREWVLEDNVKLICSKNGKVINGRIIGHNSSIEQVPVENVHFSGSFHDLNIKLIGDVDSLCYGISSIDNLIIEGDDNTVYSTSFGLLRNTNVSIKNVVFDCANCNGPFLYTIGEGRNTFVVENCRFINIPELELLISRNMLNPIIKGCEFSGTLNEDNRTHSCIVLNRFYGCKGNIVFESNSIHDCYGIAVDGIGYSKIDNVNIKIINNEIRNVSNGGIVFNGGEVTNILVEGNKISNVFCFSSCFDGDKGNAENSAINFHGFSNLTIKDNMITNCTTSAALDLDGTSSDGRQDKGTGLVCTGNKMHGVNQIYLLGINDGVISRNEISIENQSNSKSNISALVLNSCNNINVQENEFSVSQLDGAISYPILIRQNSGRFSGKISIHDNLIISESNVYLMIYDGFTGEVDAENNIATSVSNNKPLMWVNNSKAKGIRVKDVNRYR